MGFYITGLCRVMHLINGSKVMAFFFLFVQWLNNLTSIN